LVFADISALQLGYHCLRGADVLSLCALVSATEKDDQYWSALREIHTIARPVIDPHLADPGANRSHIARIAEGESFDPNQDLGTRRSISQASEPHLEFFRLANFEHIGM
jgi:hypothetical protein